MRSDPLPRSADVAWCCWGALSVHAAAALCVCVCSLSRAGVFVTILGTGSRLNHTRAGRKCTHNSLKGGKDAAAVSFDCLDFFLTPPSGSQVDRVMDSSHTWPNCLKPPSVSGRVRCFPQGPTAEGLWIFKACCERPGVKRCFVINGLKQRSNDLKTKADRNKNKNPCFSRNLHYK